MSENAISSKQTSSSTWTFRNSDNVQENAEQESSTANHVNWVRV